MLFSEPKKKPVLFSEPKKKRPAKSKGQGQPRARANRGGGGRGGHGRRCEKADNVTGLLMAPNHFK